MCRTELLGNSVVGIRSNTSSEHSTVRETSLCNAKVPNLSQIIGSLTICRALRFMRSNPSSTGVHCTRDENNTPYEAEPELYKEPMYVQASSIALVFRVSTRQTWPCFPNHRYTGSHPKQVLRVELIIDDTLRGVFSKLVA